MSAYELDDDLVRAWIHFTANEVAVEEVELREAFEKQLPLPVPTKIGAVVRCHVRNVGSLDFLRYALDGRAEEPWVEIGDTSAMVATHRTEAIGRITEVLSEGVDL